MNALPEELRAGGFYFTHRSRTCKRRQRGLRLREMTTAVETVKQPDYASNLRFFADQP
jgi:hypothetical protein